ncbi:hypothetical protein SAMN00017405_0555 [Desulfonispora thiosulfatigenes DSM 11270]|uniref:Uncharacterized protein n=1 Tax=Desulfonispora thiosulfatigenes DSM 11270 TaxID=656914 RepID=A0A1W1V7F1_DESTI|nr:hypothetical protein [Desulfonispora thiosulfatigenes]SMB88961.1 hypothetical protein SAMN00017405_0555 [Desulfonispora thiosulfatigenes DSM 11270]
MMKFEISENSAKYFEPKAKEEFNWLALLVMSNKLLHNAFIGVCFVLFIMPIIVGLSIFGIFAIPAWFITKVTGFKTRDRKHLRTGWRFTSL